MLLNALIWRASTASCGQSNRCGHRLEKLRKTFRVFKALRATFMWRSVGRHDSTQDVLMMKRLDVKALSDAELVDRYSNARDERAFTELVERHGEMVMATANRVLGNEEDAKDTLQATFMALAKAVDKVRDKSAISGWLHRTASHCAVTIRRGNARWGQKAERMMKHITSPNGERDNPLTTAVDKELMAIVDEEITRLPSKLETAIVLCDLNGESHKKVAETLGITVSAVSDRLTRGRKLLRAGLTRRGVALTVTGLASCVASSKEGVALTNYLVADVTKTAMLFAAGKSPTEIGVSLKVYRSATAAASTGFAKIVALSVIVVSIILFSGQFLRFLVASDDAAAVRDRIISSVTFDEPFPNGEPRWRLFGDGSARTSAGDLELASTNETGGDGFGVGPVGIDSRDMSIRTQVRITAVGGGAVVSCRNQIGNGPKNYFVSVNYIPRFGGSIMTVARSDGGGRQSPHLFPSKKGNAIVVLPYDVRHHDTVVQLDVIGNKIRGWAWRSDEAMPNSPQFDITDDTYERGSPVLGLFNDRKEGLGNSLTIYRHVYFADKPLHEINRKERH